MAITDKETGVWGLDQVYNKINQGSIWEYSGPRLLYTVGYNDSGELGQGLNYADRRSSPVQLSGTNWKYVSSDSSADGYVGSVKTDGTMWNWGRNENGELGINEGGAPSKKNSPNQVPGTTWSQVTTLGRQCGMVGTKTDGTAWVWGHNNEGALGLNQATTVKISSPTQIGSDTTWPIAEHKMDGDGYHIAVIKQDGTLWTWGHGNNQGQLGQNERVDYSSPVQVPGTTWKYVSVNENAVMATKTDGTLWAWGYNVSGELGHNDIIPKSSPVQIPGTTWDYISINWSASMATRTDGTLWSWGYNSYGNLGQGDNDKFSSPVQIPGTTWTGPVHMSQQAFAPKTDNTMWGWGTNGNGQLGLNQGPGQLSGTLSPVQIPGGYTSATTGSPGLTAFMKVQ